MVDRIITAYRAQIYDWSFADLLKLIKNNKKLPSHIDTNIIAARMMDAIYRSAESHKEIEL